MLQVVSGVVLYLAPTLNIGNGSDELLRAVLIKWEEFYHLASASLRRTTSADLPNYDMVHIDEFVNTHCILTVVHH